MFDAPGRTVPPAAAEDPVRRDAPARCAQSIIAVELRWGGHRPVATNQTIGEAVALDDDDMTSTEGPADGQADRYCPG